MAAIWDCKHLSGQLHRCAALLDQALQVGLILTLALGIIAKGQLVALGSPQELKNDHGSNYQLDLKLNPPDHLHDQVFVSVCMIVCVAPTTN